jgi:hypothetical protein
MGLMAIAMSFLRAPDHKEVDSIDQDIGDEHKEQPAGAILVTARGEEIRCTV